MIFIIDTECETTFPGFSYAWITGKDHYDTQGYIQDHYRTETVTEKYPAFQGCDDMEGHFEFKMTVDEVRQHLLELGLEERPYPEKWGK